MAQHLRVEQATRTGGRFHRRQPNRHKRHSDLLSWMTYETPAWRKKLAMKMPRKFWPWLFCDEIRAAAAPRGFHMLGSDAGRALPALTALARSTNEAVASRAILALLGMDISFEVVLQDLTDIQLNYARRVPGKVTGLATQAESERIWILCFTHVLRDHNSRVRTNAAAALRVFAPEVLTNAPAL